MSLNNHPHQQWMPPGHLRPPDEHHESFPINPHLRTLSRPRTPQIGLRAATLNAQIGRDTESDIAPEEDPRRSFFNDRYKTTELKISDLFRVDGKVNKLAVTVEDSSAPRLDISAEGAQSSAPTPAKRPARKLDDDDYDMDDDEDEDDTAETAVSPLKPKSTGAHASIQPAASPARPGLSTVPSSDSSKVKSKSAEDVRKQHDEDKKALEEAARKSFYTMFYTLEDDRNAMLDQQRLEEVERQADAETSGQNASKNTDNSGTGRGTLASANLGASSLTLKNLIARIDQKRDQVQASDAELRSLMSEVRKNRSKWANEDRVGQEELYEAAEKVLSELKAMTEHSSAFLTKVNRREAPDYYTIIKNPMDLGTMTKKLKSVAYKSKQEFVDDLNLIWSNCLRYNANPEHFLRKNALFMRKETEKLVPLIPDIVIRDRAEVEREERAAQMAEAEAEGAEESDDEPIMSTRGRMAPGKSAKKGTSSRKAPPGEVSEGTPGAETKPAMGSNGVGSRSDPDLTMEGSQNGFSTPPPGSITPLGVNGHVGSAPPGSQGDLMEIDGLGASINNALAGRVNEMEFEDPEYKTWKQVTKKDRALLAAERHRMFKGDKLDPEAPALLRSKAGMRRWLRNQRQAISANKPEDEAPTSEAASKEVGETLAEGMEEEQERMIPDYYDALAAIPEIPHHQRWIEDETGELIDPSEEGLHIFPSGQFVSSKSKLTDRMEANMRQIQDTRRICAKISMVKQMQLQSQVYQNQFQKYDPEPFVEQDIPSHIMRDNGPMMNPWVSKAAFQRSIGKIFYHAGFEEFQPSALDAITDIAVEYMQKLGQTFGAYYNAPKVSVRSENGTRQRKSPFSIEEVILHTLDENGTDLEALDTYVKDDVERQGSKLAVLDTRMKAHLADLLRPALVDAGPDGSNAFNDGSEQFVGGDFAEDLGEDFFGFRELGLDRELGMFTLGVPLHLLQNKLSNVAAAQNPSASASTSLFQQPSPYPAITVPVVKNQIGLVQNFFLAKLHANNDEPLVEDDDLPVKQRPAKPRLPANGKITSPLKRPSDTRPGANASGANAGSAKKKLKTGKTNAGVPGPGAAESNDNNDTNKDMPNGIPASKVGPLSKPVGKLKLSVPNNANLSAATGLDGSTDVVKNVPNGTNNKNNGTENSSTAPTEASSTATANAAIPPPAKVNGTSSSQNNSGGGQGGPVGSTSARDGAPMPSPESINGHL